MPNKYVEKSQQAFEKLRKDEVAGRIQPYNQLFLQNMFLKQVY